MCDGAANGVGDDGERARLAEELAAARVRAAECEDRFRAVMMQSVDVIYRRDLRSDRYDYLSPAIARITGFTAEEFAAFSFEEVVQRIHPDDRGAVKAHLQQFASRREGGEISHFFEYRLLCRDGAYKWLSDSGSVLFGEDGAPLYHVGVARDITVRKGLEDELKRHAEGLELAVAERTARLRRLAAELTQAEQRERKRLSDFLHDDLQQILVAAKYNAERLVAELPEGPAGQDARKQLSLVAEAVGKLRDFCAGLSQPLLYMMGLEPALRELCAKMLSRYGLEVRCEVGDLLEIQDDAVKTQVFLAVRELLFNVAKHAGVQAARLSAGCAGGRVEIRVEDDGRGFDAQAASGSGCGLFNVAERLRDLGGEVRVEAAPGRGTSVRISVPVAAAGPRAPVVGAPSAAAPRDARKAGASGGRRARVLVVDDHDLVRNGVKSLLARQGTLEVVGEGRNGREAVELVRQLRPDVVVMDIRMPVMDGVEATRQIHAEWPEVVIVGVSAFGDESFRPTMLGAGAAGLLDKADAGSKLPALIASCLAARNKGATR